MADMTQDDLRELLTDRQINLLIAAGLAVVPKIATRDMGLAAACGDVTQELDMMEDVTRANHAGNLLKEK